MLLSLRFVLTMNLTGDCDKCWSNDTGVLSLLPIQVTINLTLIKWQVKDNVHS